MVRANEGAPPLYWQLAEQLRRSIADGHYRDGMQLPTEEMLGQEFGVSRITVRGALDRLAAEGLVRRERGRGTFVVAPPIKLDLGQFSDFAEDMSLAGFRSSSRVVNITEEPATAAVAAQLGIAPETPVVRVDRLRLADDQPLAFDRTYLPLRFGRLLDHEALASETILRQLESGFNIAIVSGRYIIEATIADSDLAAHLAIAPGDPVLLTHRTSHTTGDERVFYQQRYYRGDRVCYALDLRRGQAGAVGQVVARAPLLDLPQ